MAKTNIGIGFDDMDVESMEFDENGELIEGGDTTPNDNDSEENNGHAEDDHPEVVGNGTKPIVDDGDDSEGGSTTPKRSGSSPNKYSSIATTMRDEGAFDASDEELAAITDVDSYMDFLRAQAMKRMDETTKGYAQALNNGANVDKVSIMFQNNKIVNSIREEDVENEENSDLRRQIIEQNYLNKGYSENDAQKLAKMAFDEAKDVDEAKAALAETKQYYKNAIDGYNARAKADRDARYKAMSDRSERIRKSVIEDKNAFGGMDVDAKTRKEIFSAINDIAAKDKNGVAYNRVQKLLASDYEKAMKLFAYACVMTNDGNDFSKLMKDASKREVSKARQELMDFIEGSDNSNGHMHLVGQHQAASERKVGLII